MFFFFFFFCFVWFQKQADFFYSCRMSLIGDVCLITGACGFLGQKIIQLLIEENELAEIRLLDLNINPKLMESLEAIRGQTKITKLEGDIRDIELLKKACQDVSLVIHTASLIDILGLVDKNEMTAVNVTGTQLLLETCLQKNVKYFIYTSTLEVAGPNKLGDSIINGNEDTPDSCCLRFTYSVTKQKAEQITLQTNGKRLHNGEQIVTCSLRPTYIYGEGSRFIRHHFDTAIRNGNVLKRTSKKEALVNPVYVGNVAWAHILSAKAMKDLHKAKQIGGHYFYISDDTPHMSYSDFNDVLLKPLGIIVPEKLVLPMPLLFFLAFVMEMLQFLLKPFVKYTPSMNRQLLTMLNTHFTFTYAKAQKAFGYTPRYRWTEAKTTTSEWLSSVLSERCELVKKMKTH
uniref:Hydroxy-delta-5-steroid dehydrogenase, 3 beta- and steroid delta-isomerase 1 n=2 Tax=Erpetoichthys calabaricus TaxID=27687 RepID=A0A8C4RXT0_ERPCA